LTSNSVLVRPHYLALEGHLGALLVPMVPELAESGRNHRQIAGGGDAQEAEGNLRAQARSG
jgi:hypothetical protein